MKCEKKLVDDDNGDASTSAGHFDFQRYDTEIEIGTDGASSNSSNSNDKKSGNKSNHRKSGKRYRFLDFFRPNPDASRSESNTNQRRDADSIWDDILSKNNNGTASFFSNEQRSDFATRTTARTNANVELGPTTTRRISATGTARYHPEEHWKQKVSKFSEEHRGLLAESLFSHVWKTQGESVAKNLLEGYDRKGLEQSADDHFDNGCQLWAWKDTVGARWELELTQRIREIDAPEKSLVHVMRRKERDDRRKETLSDFRNLPPICESESESNSNSNSKSKHSRNSKNHNASSVEDPLVESNAELFFALGMVRAARQEFHAALREFRRGIQVAALGLGFDHELTKASSFMIRTTLVDMGYQPHQIQHSLEQLHNDLHHEVEGDLLYQSGKKEQALVEYANVNFLYDSDAMVQARVKTKIASVFDEMGDHTKSMDLWSDLLVVYDDAPSIGLRHPMARLASEKIARAQRQLQAWSEI